MYKAKKVVNSHKDKKEILINNKIDKEFNNKYNKIELHLHLIFYQISKKNDLNNIKTHFISLKN